MAVIHDSVSREQKAVILLLIDGALIPLCLVIALQLRLGEIWPDRYFGPGAGLFVMMPLIGMTLSWIMGVPHIVLRAFENTALYRLARYALVMAVICTALNSWVGFGLPRSIPGIWAAVFLVMAVMVRLLLVSGLNVVQARRLPRKKVLIYGAGVTGQQMMAALRNSADVTPIAFVDDNPSLQRVEVAGMRVYPPTILQDFVQQRGVEQIILAMPSATRRQQQDILSRIEPLGVEVQTLPSFVDMLDGRALTDQLRQVTPDDLLGRDTVDLSDAGITAAYFGKSILVSGAGGSIGSELVRQILAAKPKRLVLYEQSELALYTISQDLSSRDVGDIEVISALGSVTDAGRVTSVLQDYAIQTILHAAAYKHVPLVEDNALEGARNNIIGTQTLADAAVNAGVERFILISTDKAVRPTNVMGATKRMAEMVIQDRQTRAGRTIFTMVRFGNVLGSSGSVIPLFRQQISNGGPVTVTHADVTRYFMTIPEAAQLVLLAGSFAEGGEVFVLDMGKSVKIMALARRMIELSGFTVRDTDSPDGDIEIAVTGLRPGEKLFEELLIGENVVGTPHPKIMRAMEGMPSQIELAGALRDVVRAITDGEPDLLRSTLRKWVDGYQPTNEEAAL